MSEVFLKVVNMSISAGWLVLAILALRLILKKAPKWVNVLLWGIVAIRLICPFSIESEFSLMPESLSSGTLVNEWTDDYIGHNHFINEDSEYYNDAIAAGREPISDGEGGHYVATGADRISEPSTVRNTVVPKLAILWGIGMSLMVAYTAISYLTLRHKLRTAVILRENIFQCETVSSPFVLGILKPRIYLPYAMDGKNLSHVVAHEKAHIRRKDHWWKPLGFLLLTVYWFNPLMWVAYILLCRDIELACDEKVIAELGNEQRADYTQALVACAVNRRMIAACPLAFGEVGVKERIRSVMNYKKPTFWIIVTALVVCVVVAVCFLTNPKDIKTPMHIIDTLSTEDVQWSQITIWEDESPHILLTDEQIQDLMGILKDLDDRDFLRSRGIERNVSLMINCGEIEFLLHWDGEYTAFYFDAATHELVDQEYCYVKSNELNLFLSQFYPIQVGTSRPEVKWFDYTENPSNMSYDRELKIRLEEFPGITFKYTPHGIVAVGEDEASADETMLISGLPVWSAYFCDLTGDGKPEICSQISYGSGIIDNRVIIFDYANGVSYKLENRGYHDYYLRMEGAYLHVDKKVYNSDDLVSSGRLVFKDGCIQIEGEDVTPTNILQAKLLEIHDGYFVVEPMEGSWELSSSSEIEVPMKNMEPSPEPLVGDILEIEYDGQLQETYPARITAVYGIRVISERPYVTEALTLNEVAELVKQQHIVSFVGMTREAVHGYWGKPDYEAFGFFGDIYHVPDTFESVVFRYDESETVTGVEIEYRNEVPGDALFIVKIRDREKEEHLICAEAEELFFEDDEYEYYFNVIKSHYVIVTYNNANSEDIITALNSGRATIADLDEFDIEYTKKPKS